MYTQRLGLKLLHHNQSQKEVVINENMAKLDTLLGCSVLSMDTSSPPSKPEFGAAFIVGLKPYYEWEGHCQEIACYQGYWQFYKPKPGMLIWVRDTMSLVVYEKEEWHVLAELKVKKGLFGNW